MNAVLMGATVFGTGVVERWGAIRSDSHFGCIDRVGKPAAQAERVAREIIAFLAE